MSIRRRINFKEKKEFVLKKIEKKRMRQAKRDTSWKEIETEGKWQKHDTNRFYRKKEK